MPSVLDFLVLLVVVLLLMILYFLTEMDRAVRHRVTADNNERRAVRRPESLEMYREEEEGGAKTIAFRLTGIVPPKMMNARAKKTGYAVLRTFFCIT